MAANFESLFQSLKRGRRIFAGLAVVGLIGSGLFFLELSLVWQSLVAVASVGAVLSGLIGYWITYRTVKVGMPGTDAAKAALSEPGAGASSRRGLSIVVLPFSNHTGDAGQAYVADAMTVGISSDLARIRGAAVISTATAFTYKDKAVNIEQVGRELGVHFVLHGSVQRSGTAIRINAQLADATSSIQLWSECFEGDQSELFVLQDQVTTRIRNSVGREMVLVVAREREAQKGSPQVVDLLLRAGALMFHAESLENWQQIEMLCNEVLLREPDNSRAMVLQAMALTLSALHFESALGTEKVEQHFSQAQALAARARPLDPENPGIYLVLGVYAAHIGDLESCQRACETRLALDANEPYAYNGLAHCLIQKGEPGKAIEVLLKAIALDPMHPAIGLTFLLGMAYFMQENYDEAIEWMHKTIDRTPGHPNSLAILAMAYAMKGDTAHAQPAAAEVHRLNPHLKAATLGRVRPTSSVAYKKWYEKKFLPAWRRAGLPGE